MVTDSVLATLAAGSHRSTRWPAAPPRPAALVPAFSPPAPPPAQSTMTTEALAGLVQVPLAVKDWTSTVTFVGPMPMTAPAPVLVKTRPVAVLTASSPSWSDPADGTAPSVALRLCRIVTAIRTCLRRG